MRNTNTRFHRVVEPPNTSADPETESGVSKTGLHGTMDITTNSGQFVYN